MDEEDERLFKRFVSVADMDLEKMRREREAIRKEYPDVKFFEDLSLEELRASYKDLAERSEKRERELLEQLQKEANKVSAGLWGVFMALGFVGVLGLMWVLLKFQDWEEATGRDLGWLVMPTILLMVFGVPALLGIIGIIGLLGKTLWRAIGLPSKARAGRR